MTDTYAVGALRDLSVEALTTRTPGPTVVNAQSECQLNRQRREKPRRAEAVAAGRRVVRERFGVDPDSCTGDRACIRISGCLSLTVTDNPDPLRTDPIATALDSCVGCGANAHAAVLCPSFYRTDVVDNPTRRDRALAWLRGRWIAVASHGLERRAALFEAAP